MIRLPRLWRPLAAVALLLALLWPALPVQPAPSAAAPADPNVIPGQYIVVLRDDLVGAADVGAADIAAQVEAADETTVTHVYTHALNGFAAELSAEAAADLAADPRVAEIVPDRKVYPFAQTLTPGANRVDADLNPTAKIDGRDERVNADIAVLDMGVGPNADLNIVGGHDCTGSGTLRRRRRPRHPRRRHRRGQGQRHPASSASPPAPGSGRSRCSAPTAVPGPG